MWQLAMVAIGGAAGALARYGATQYVRQLSEGSWPLATLSVNVLGSLGIGAAWVLLERTQVPADLRYLLVVGFFGAFTTFSTFSLELLVLLQEGRLGAAASYVIASVLTCLVAVWVGVFLVRALS